MNLTGRALAQIGFVSLLVAGRAYAGPAGADPSQADEAAALDDKGARLARAKAEFARATTAYRLGKFEEALEAYERSYEAAPLPAILFNMGQCELQLKHYERALFFFQGYLQGAPDASNRAFVRSQIQEATRRLADRTETERQRREAEEQRLALEAKVLELTLAQRRGAPAPPSAARDPGDTGRANDLDVEAEPSTGVPGGLLLWTVAGAGAASGALLVVSAAGLTAGSVVLAVRAASAPPTTTLGTVDYR